MLDTSQDILYITLAISIAVFTVFLVWIMYYVAQISRQSNEMITDFRAKLAELDAAITDIHQKVSDTIDTVAELGEKVSAIAGVVSTVGGAVKSRVKSSRAKKK